MLNSLPKNSNFRRLFFAQVISLAGTGVSTIALALLAHKLSGAAAGEILGVALAIKMVVYVFATPVLSVYADRFPRRRLMILLDLLRGATVGGFFLVSEAWHVYLLIFLLSFLSAAFTPVLMATIPDLLEDEQEYNRAVSLTRIAYDLENVLSPMLAGALLLATTYSTLFIIDGFSFIVSALIIAGSRVPESRPSELPESVLYRIWFGVSSYLKTPRLRYALGLCWIVSFASAMVIVNSVVIIRENLGGTESQLANAYIFSGIGSILAAFFTPALLNRFREKTVMGIGALLLATGLGAGYFIDRLWVLFTVWTVLGLGWSLVQTPVGQLIKKSSLTADRPAYYAAHFALSHTGWLVAYPLVGFAGRYLSMAELFLVLAVTALAVTVYLELRWQPGYAGGEIRHSHTGLQHSHHHEHDLHHNHEHRPEAPSNHEHSHEGVTHSHYFVIDLHHRHWPK